MLKKWIAFALAVVMAMSVLPMAVLADTEPTAETVAPTETTAPAETTAPTDTTQPANPEDAPTAPEEKPKVEVAPLGPWGAVTPPHELRTQSARIERLRHAIRWDYQSALKTEEAETLYGFCGLLAGYQMHLRGINTWRKVNDGKDYFDTYKEIRVTSGGYVPKAYSAEDNTLEEILNQITNYGNREVYNLLVCFEKTNTVAGQKYGHVVFIYGIIGGKLYFTEGGNMFGVDAGEPMECTISRFAASYGTWTEFEGVIELGCRDYMDNCVSYKSDLFATCVEAAPVLAMPYENPEEEPLRTLMVGERVHVIGLYENRERQYFYQVDDGGSICYVPQYALETLLLVHENFSLTEPKIPETLTPKKDFTVDGTVEAPGELMSNICVQILDVTGTVVEQYTTKTEAVRFDLGNYRVNQALHFNKLEEGVYTYRVTATSKIGYMLAGKVAYNLNPTVLVEQTFYVGAAPRIVEEPVPEKPPQARNGWVYENQTWYCYNQNVPRTGWLEDNGIRYYLKEDGSVTTGWAEVDGQRRLFTATGAMRVGWVTTQEGKMYMDADGIALLGWQKIGQTRLYFDANGLWQQDHAQVVLQDLTRLGEELAKDLGIKVRKQPKKKEPLK